MPTLYHHPLCPHSRYVRLMLAEYGVAADLVEERAFERRHEFLLLDPAGRTPVIVGENGVAIGGGTVICEFFDDLVGDRQGDRRLMPEDPVERAETRRLVEWFNLKFHQDVSNHLVTEKVYKRFMSSAIGGGAPNMDVVRVARNNARAHLRYIGFLIGGRNWLAGDRMTLADLAAAAHLSCVDYLGDAPWAEDETAKNWYARMKSRPSFRPLLADRVMGVTPAEHYADLDF